MAVGHFEFFSEALQRTVSFHLVLPNDIRPEWRKDNPHFERPMKTLMLLHGYFGSSTDWLYKSDIVELASTYNIAVILPSGENSFYTNGVASGRKYADYVGEELLHYVQDTFQLSKNRNDTFIGGFSMGGFGAILTALGFHENYGKAFALSSALITDNIHKMEKGHQKMANYEYYELVFGELSKVKQTENHPLYLVQQLKEKGETIPDLFLACGKDDWLLDGSRQFVQSLEELNVPVVYHEAEGGHDFVFWNEWIEPAIKWLLNQVKS